MFGLQTSSREEKLLNELILRSLQQEAHFEKFYKEHGVSKEQLLEFISDPKNFDDETWQQMEAIRKEIAAEVQAKLEQLSDPVQTKKTYSDLKKAREWILVR